MKSNGPGKQALNMHRIRPRFVSVRNWFGHDTEYQFETNMKVAVEVDIEPPTIAVPCATLPRVDQEEIELWEFETFAGELVGLCEDISVTSKNFWEKYPPFQTAVF